VTEGIASSIRKLTLYGMKEGQCSQYVDTVSGKFPVFPVKIAVFTAICLWIQLLPKDTNVQVRYKQIIFLD